MLCPAALQVQTDTPKVKESIRGVLSLLKANHPADCMTCDVNGVLSWAGGMDREHRSRVGLAACWTQCLPCAC